MKTRALVRRKAKKRRFCNANRRPKESNDERETAVRPVRPRPFSDNSIVNQQQSLAVAHGQMATSPSTSTPKVSVKEVRNRSAEKLKNSVICKIDRSPKKGRVTRRRSAMTGRIKKQGLVEGSGYSLIEVKRIQECISSAAICGKCRNPKSQLTLFEDESFRNGLAQQFFLKCSHCKMSTELTSSHKTKSKGPFDVNVRAVHAASKGLGHKGLSKFCASTDLPKPPNVKAFNGILKNLSAKSYEQALKCTKEASERLIKITQEEEPENIEVCDNGAHVAKVAVTVDGTWQRRGHCSKNGVVFVLSVETGEVLDFAIKTMTCHECVKHGAEKMLEAEYEEWMNRHKCSINHTGSSDSMETQSAKEIFLRSPSTRNLKYTTFVGDGDSDCFANVKEECYKTFKEDY